VPQPLPPSTRAALLRPWHVDPHASLRPDLFSLMPVRNLVWPVNTLFVPKLRTRLITRYESYWGTDALPEGPVVQAYRRAAVVDSVHDALFGVMPPTGVSVGEIVLQPPIDPLGERLIASQSSNRPPVEPPLRSISWSWNELGFTTTVDRPSWLLVRQLYDRDWHVTVDGHRVQPARANVVGMGIPVEAGRHRVELDFRPAARRMYWPLMILLELTLALLVALALWWPFSRARSGSAPARRRRRTRRAR
jgi:hypothetical protein